MLKELHIEPKREVLSLAAGISYALVPDWYAGTQRDLKMSVIHPKHGENHAAQPCLLFVCGGAFSVVNGAIWMPELMYFAERGYTVATIDYRTSNESNFPAALIDVKSAVRFLKAHAERFCVDPERIAIAGESAGGALASLAGTVRDAAYDQGDFLEYDSSVAAVVDYYGVVDMNGALAVESENGAVHSWTMEAFLGSCDAATAQRASALFHASSDAPPFMILHGTKDVLVDIETQSDRFYQRLEELGVQVEYCRLLDAEHGDDLFYQDEVKAMVLDFLNRAMK